MEKQAPGAPQSCSVCLEPVPDGGGDRSIAKLKCGHHFHLDCIGSAFNAKGSMQCPNCRYVEEGQWLYANGYRRQDEFTLADMIYGEGFDIYAGVSELFLPQEEMHFGHMEWCPYRSSYPQFSFSVEEVGHSSTGHADLIVNVLVGEPTNSFHPTHPCPFVHAQGIRSARHLPISEDNMGIQNMPSSSSQDGAYVIASGAAFRHVTTPHGGNWVQPNTTHMAVSENGSVHSYDRFRWGRTDVERLSRASDPSAMQFSTVRPGEVSSGVIGMHNGLPHGQSQMIPGNAASSQPPLQFSPYTATNAHNRRPRGRVPSQLPHVHYAHSRGIMTAHVATWGAPITAVGQETGVETGRMDGPGMTRWRSEDSPVIPLFPLEPESQRWMRPASQPPSSSLQSGSIHGPDLSMQGSIGIPEGSLVNHYQGHFSVFSGFPSDPQADIGPLHPSFHPS